MKYRYKSLVDHIIDANARLDDARGVIEALSVDDERFSSALDEFEAAMFAREQLESLRAA